MNNNTILTENIFECSICLNNIVENNNNIISCSTCNNKNCIECFNKMQKKFNYHNNEFYIIYTCPVCKTDKSIDVLDNNNILKYNLKNFINNYLIELNNKIIELNITNGVMNNKILEYKFYFNNFYKIVKYAYIVDKFVFLLFSSYVILLFKS
jgi:hypothetical protein|uniref:RING-type domain-containing protein n=1 Tax=viral metagenome TaxID=1070528 RepID=A0A6C0JNZ0_9ZZZZ